MKRGVKIALWVIGALAILLIAAFMSADIIASRIVKKEVAKAFANMPDADASVGGIYLNLISGSAFVKDITFCTNSMGLEDSDTGERAPGLAVHVPALAIWNIHYWELLRERRLVIHAISVDDAILMVYMDEKNPKAIIPVFPEDTTLKKANQWLHSIEVHSFTIDKFRARFHSTRSPLSIAVDSLCLETQDWAYNLIDSTLSYNDSAYTLDIRSLKLETPDGFFELEAHDLQTANQGALSLGYARLRNIFSPKQMADMHKEPITWLDLELNRLSTSPLNPVRKIMAQDYTLDLLQVDVKRLHVCRDARHKPKKPFSTPQDFLRHLPTHFLIKRVDASARAVDVEFASTNTNCGHMHLKNIRTSLSNVTNKAGAVWRNHAKAPFGKKGIVEASYTMHMDKAASFDVHIDAKNVETEDLNGFIRPLIGITSKCHIDHLDASYSGNKTAASGQFCMEYHGLDVKVHKEDKIPYEVVTKNADMFTNLANSLVPKSNPTSVDPAPRKYLVEWKRDEWKPYPFYLFGPCIDGIKKTMLPGLYVHKQAPQTTKKTKK